MLEIRSLEEAEKEFSTEAKCVAYLIKKRWPSGVVCPRCGTKHPAYMPRYRRWYCKTCDYSFSITAGTIFHATKLPLTKWMVAVWFLCHSPKGCSAKQLERILGVHYETAWSMAHRIRKAMGNDAGKLGGLIEIDSAVIKADGGKATGNISYGAKDVLGVAERGGELRLFVLDSLSKANIVHVVLRNLGKVETVYTDACYKLRFLSKLYPHKSINHWLTYGDEDAHVNQLENAFSLFKRGLSGLFQHVSAKYLQLYLDEFAFRYSHRKEKRVLFDLVLANSEAGR
ncbi:MAG: IS1595 family transposase [Candidatus Bipolaricaulis sp.]|nr:IS1595 family transposase [Candidatus Bipolaricaulis sp.]